jgi:N-acetyl-gamma-glutamyl-phosphate reductase
MSSSNGLRLRAAVAGATGYIGMQCVELLSRHPNVELTRLLGRSNAGRRFDEVVPGSRVSLVLEDGMDVDGADVVFAALPHTVAASQAAAWVAKGAVVVDMSADFRLRDAAVYERWYKVTHPAPELCATAVYALPELPGATSDLADADILAAPGCYPTATLLAAVPALHANLVERDVVADCKSGVSGAGRSPSLGVHFAEVNESVHAYGVEGHRHKAEMVQQMRIAAGSDDVRLTFVPHLIPMTRGILATLYMRPRDGVSVERIREEYREFCDGGVFLRYDETPPRTKSVSGTNLAALNVSEQDGVCVVTCAIDNLLKGAAGQGIQAFNLRFALDETAGLPLQPAWP